MLKTHNFTQRVLQRVARRSRNTVIADPRPSIPDPLSHPALACMSLDQLADLPFSRSGLSDGNE